MFRKKRKFARLNANLPVKVILKSENATSLHYVFSKNISLAGICLGLSRYDQLWDELKGCSSNIYLEIKLPDIKEALNVTAKICWIDIDKIGLKFIEIGTGAVIQITNYMNKKMDNISS